MGWSSGSQEALLHFTALRSRRVYRSVEAFRDVQEGSTDSAVLRCLFIVSREVRIMLMLFRFVSQHPRQTGEGLLSVHARESSAPVGHPLRHDACG